jgi:hypothetical protein
VERCRRFDLPLRIPKALPNNKQVEPNHGTGGKRDHVVHSFFLCAKRINRAHESAYRDLALAGRKLRCRFKLSAQETHTFLATAAKQISFARAKVQL